MSSIKAIRNDADYQEALARIDALMDAEAGTPDGEELDVLTDLLAAWTYSEAHLVGKKLALVHFEEDDSLVIRRFFLEGYRWQVAGGAAMDARVDSLKAAMAGQPYIFNLGHGIVPQTPPDHVGRLVERLHLGAAQAGRVVGRRAGQLPIADLLVARRLGRHRGSGGRSSSRSTALPAREDAALRRRGDVRAGRRDRRRRSDACRRSGRG